MNIGFLGGGNCTMNDGTSAAEQRGDFAQAFAFVAYTRSLSALVRGKPVLPANVLPTPFGVSHTGDNTVADLVALKFRNLRHHAKHKPAGWRLEIHPKRGDDNVDTARIQVTSRGEGVQGAAAEAVNLPDDQAITVLQAVQQRSVEWTVATRFP
jgi:hypothetical protein